MKRIFFSIALFAVAMPTLVSAEDYKLGPMDKLRIKAIEWRPGQGEYFEWSAISGEYVVDPSGVLMLPLIGGIPVKGKSTQEVSQAVQQELQQRTGMTSKPNASVEVVEYGPIYVIGDAAKPGEFPFRPEMTVVKALSIAGGVFRPGDAAAFVAMGREQITAEGTISLSEVDLKRSLLRRGRLLAEFSDVDTIRGDEKPEADPELVQLLDQEDAILKSRNIATRSKRASLRELVTLYNQQISAIEAKKTSQALQIELARKSRDNIADLQKRGLAVNNQTIAAERMVAELQSSMLDLESAAILAKQNLNKAQRDEIDLDSDRQARIILELQETDKHLDELKSRLSTTQSVMQLTSMATNVMAQTAQASMSDKVSYRITRRGSDDVPFDFAADENTRVQPGDVIRVSAKPANGSGSVQTASSPSTAAPHDSLTTFVKYLIRVPTF